MQNDGHRGAIVFRPRGNRLIYEDREATDAVRVALGGGMRFTIFPVVESTHVPNVFKQF